MSETVNNKTIFSLLEVTNSIQKTLTDRYSSSFWVKAEMNKLNYYKHSGHCYPDLLEKHDGKVIAQINSHLWKDDYLRVNNEFLKVLKEPLKDGIKILFLAKISYDPAHGLSLWIMDIDPSYTLGDLEKEKQQTIQQLKVEGIFERNKLNTLSLLPQRIAIISVETSKGYADFLEVIETNVWKYKFFHLLFPSILQGDGAVQAITAQLDRIKKVINHFDVVAIIRGGGGDVGLSCYNSYLLAKEIAMFPLPVITGIGHATNETVIEMISYSNAITPTKLAEYLIQKFHNFSVPVQDAENKIIDKSKRLLIDANYKFQSEIKLFRSVTGTVLSKKNNEINNIGKTLIQHAKFKFKNENEFLYVIRTNIQKSTNYCFISAQQKLNQFSITIRKDAGSQLKQYELIVNQYKEKVTSYCLQQFRSAKMELNGIEKNIMNMSPQNVLKRGYSITLLNGKSVKNISHVKAGDELDTTLFEGNITSIVK